MLRVIIFLIPVILLVLACLRLHRYWVERHQRGIFKPWPVAKANLQELSPRFELGELGPTLATEVSFLSDGQRGVPGGTSDLESWILAVLAKDAERMFEFGTCTGKSTYLWARNSSPTARITTLTLSPDQVGSYQAEQQDDANATRAAQEESCFSQFLYSNTDVADKIEQLFNDSKAFDEAPYHESCDLIFIDGSHAYSYIKSDTEKAMKMLKPGGLVIWHDYHGPRRARGVFRYLNELCQQLPIKHLRGTCMVFYRKPLAIET